ncbi:ATP-binding protein [Gordonia sp. LSe1-13]|uniref:histidine kinase n=1 Tax=Gordonia sesuvii TaxID=3116777 RepID=A0ABU7MDH1_9ACTN|nr:ATP-binding protein [Gordonia sp. LSe1-13]
MATPTMTRPASTGSAPVRPWRRHLIGPTDGSDLARIRRYGSRFIGCGLLVFTAGLTPLIVAQAEVTAAWWPPVSMLLVSVPALLVIVASYRPRLPHLTALAFGCNLGVAVAVALWFVAWTGDLAPDGSSWSVWLVQFPGVAGLLFGMTGHPRLGVVHIVAITLLAQTANLFGLYGELRLDLYLGSLLQMALTVVFLAVAVVTVRTARFLDGSRAAAIEQAAASAASVAQDAERSRFAALIHDKVIAILLAVDVGRPQRGLRAQAASALDELDRRDDDEPSTTIGADEFVHRIRSALASMGDDIDRELTIEPDSTGPHPGDDTVARSPGAYPTDVVTAILDAMCEAIRNVRRHAGGDASCLVVGNLRADEVSVAVVDDGCGFDPASVRPERFGVAVGIRRRMESIPGGSAQVQSAPGRGTTVILGWLRECHDHEAGRHHGVSGTEPAAMPRRRSAIAEHETSVEPMSDDAVDIFGLRSPQVVRALLALGVTYVIVTIGSGLEIRSVWNWVGLTVAFVVLAGDLALLTRRRGDPLPLRDGCGALALMVIGTGTAWWSVPAATFEPAQCLPAAIGGIVVLALLAIRGRVGIAWVGAVAMSLSAGIWGWARDIGFVDGIAFTSWVYPVMLFASLFAVMLRPIAAGIRTLRARAVRFAADDAALAAATDERDRQLALLDREARPMLQKVAAGHVFRADEVALARLIEAQLRDGIRAPAWQSGQVRAAVWQARRRGVAVVLLDDGGMNDARGLQARLDDLVVAELAKMRSGRVTARVMPPGRATRATIVATDDSGVRRHDCAADGTLTSGSGALT